VPLRFRFAVLPVAIALLVACGRTHSKRGAETLPPSDALQTVADHATAPPFLDTSASSDRARRIWQEAQRFYKETGYRLTWSDGVRPFSDVEDLVRILGEADREGLDPSTYHIDDLKVLARGKLDEAAAVRLDVQATYRYLQYAWRLRHGAIDPEKVDHLWHSSADNVDIVSALESGLDEIGIDSSLRQLTPHPSQYEALKRLLARERSAPDTADSKRRIQQIILNMDRWRWMPDDLGRRYIIVNVPAFQLDVIEDGKSVLTMRAVVGKRSSPTPVLADRMTSIVFSPYWNIPSKIVSNEMLPHAARDAEYLARHNIEIVRQGSKGGDTVDPRAIDLQDDASHLRFRQRPGGDNSLGLVKFVFPNHFDVYLHDTPAKSLFKRAHRALSHGCVRIERPIELAQYLLRDQPSWTEENIEKAIRSGRERSVTLEASIPVYLTYFTAWDENGELRLADDVYGYDQKQQAASAQASS